MTASELGDKIIHLKKMFKMKYSGLESDYDKNNHDLEEEYILEAQDAYVELCKQNGIEPTQEVMSWD